MTSAKKETPQQQRIKTKGRPIYYVNRHVVYVQNSLLAFQFLNLSMIIMKWNRTKRKVYNERTTRRRECVCALLSLL